MTEGRNLTETIEMGTDAASGWILDEMEDGNTYPAPSDYKAVPCPEGSFVNLLVLDIDTYAEKYGSKFMRKNITIPAWLNTYRGKNHINFSKVLQDALVAVAQKK
ncbi:MAG: type II toxin-antitoxin system HicB family antitoxin [Clostridiales bacterium]|nr:type II toxin-antitoxin system HicB family antitoxin [Clostridiales bacterium]